MSKLLDEKLDKLNEQFSTRFGKIEKATLNISEKYTKLNEDMTAVSHKANTNEDSIENLRKNWNLVTRRLTRLKERKTIFAIEG